MQELQYFYSKTGTVSGPVTMPALKKLIREKVVDSSCYLCREGDDQWEPLNPELFQTRPALPVATQTKGVRPKRKRSSWYSATRLMDPHIRRNLSIVTWMSIFLGGLLELHLRYVVFAASEVEPDSPLEVLGFFIGASGMIGILGYLFSLMFAESHRRLGRAIGMFSFAVILSTLSYVGLSVQSAGPNPATAPAADSSQLTPTN